MASDILHLKDSYYFEVPKFLWVARHRSVEEFPDWVVRVDPDFQRWEAAGQYEGLERIWAQQQLAGDPPPLESLLDGYEQWKSDAHRFGYPFHEYLATAPEHAWFQGQLEDAAFRAQWQAVVRGSRDESSLAEYRAETEWAPYKIATYNKQLSGKVAIPQPFAELRNFYEVEKGFGISRLMIIELVVAILLIVVFTWVAARMRTSLVPRGRLWNLLEATLIFIRDNIARPSIGRRDADRFVPLLWTFFLFIALCNLFGLVPWAGSPTGVFGVTATLALMTFATVLSASMLRLGLFGYWVAQVPRMDLPLYLAVFIVPMVWLIEVAGNMIRHTVLAVRLLATVSAGHLVLLAIIGMGWGIEGWTFHWPWLGTAAATIVGATLFSLLELFLAFLKAYIFTFLSALFISAALHHH